MNKGRTYLDYLLDIQESLTKIRAFVGEQSFHEFSVDEKTVYTTIHALEIIGEAAKKVPVEFQHHFPEIPWHQMAAQRDHLIHDYFGVDLEFLWKTIQEDLRPLEKDLDEAIRYAEEIGNNKMGDPEKE